MTAFTFDDASADDIRIATATIYGEARGETEIGRLAVAHVITNRAMLARGFRAKNGKPHPLFGDGTLAGACKARLQFSCWNGSDPNRPAVERIATAGPNLGDSVQRRCLAAVLAAVETNEPDPTMGATHYHAASVSPAWAKGLSPLAIGRHLFYRDVP